MILHRQISISVGTCILDNNNNTTHIRRAFWPAFENVYQRALLYHFFPLPLSTPSSFSLLLYLIFILYVRHIHHFQTFYLLCGRTEANPVYCNNLNRGHSNPLYCILSFSPTYHPLTTRLWDMRSYLGINIVGFIRIIMICILLTTLWKNLRNPVPLMTSAARYVTDVCNYRVIGCVVKLISVFLSTGDYQLHISYSTVICHIKPHNIHRYLKLCSLVK